MQTAQQKIHELFAKFGMNKANEDLKVIPFKNNIFEK